MLTTCTEPYVSFHVNVHYSFSDVTKTETGNILPNINNIQFNETGLCSSQLVT